jgi:hypothetical protein
MNPAWTLGSGSHKRHTVARANRRGRFLQGSDPKGHDAIRLLGVAARILKGEKPRSVGVVSTWTASM